MAAIKPNSMTSSANSSINQANDLLRKSRMSFSSLLEETQSLDYAISGLLTLGVNPDDIFSASSLGSFLNNDIGPENLISVVVEKSKQDSALVSDCVIYLISKTDSFDLSINSSYSRPLNGGGGSDILSALGGTIKSLTNAVNPALQIATGLSAFNKLSYLPVWTGSQPITKTLNCFLLATSKQGAQDQVDRAITTLQTLTLPQSTGSGLLVKSPGSTFNSDALKNLISSSKNKGKNSSPGQSNNNIAQVFGSGDRISIGLGSLAIFSPVVITDVSVTIPNLSSNYSTGALTDYIGSTFIDNYSSTSVNASIYADVSITFQTYYPPCHNAGSDFDAYTLFPYRNYAYSDIYSVDAAAKEASKKSPQSPTNPVNPQK